jgi:hypothetical protein
MMELLMPAQVCPFRCARPVSVEHADAAGNVLEYHCKGCDAFFVPGVTPEDVDPQDGESFEDWYPRMQAVLRGEMAVAA